MLAKAKAAISEIAPLDIVPNIAAQSWRDSREGEHFVQFYREEPALIESVGDYFTAGIESNAIAIVIATSSHRDALLQRWQEAGIDTSRWLSRERLLMLDAEQTLAAFMDGDTPQFDRFMATVGATIAQAARRNERIVAFGEMVALLWGRGLRSAAAQLEGFWNTLATQYAFKLFCAYPLEGCAAAADIAAFDAICGCHGRVIPPEHGDLSRDEAARTVARLHQHSHALAQELSRRDAVEDGLALLSAIVANSDDAIISKTLEGNIRSWNAGAERIFGYRAEEVVGGPITIIIPPEHRHEETEILSRLRQGEHIDHFETVRVTKSGKRIPISLTVSPVRNSRGEIIGASKIARDISERQQAEEALRESDRRKDEFLAMLAHELRNPLAPIRFATAINRRVPSTPPQQRADAIIERQIEHMSRLLDDLLDVSRITRGKIKLHTTSVDLNDVIAAAIETARPAIEAKGHRLSVSLPPHALRIEGDAVRLSQIFSNLLLNAAKYTESNGSIGIEVEVSAKHGVSITVKDNGIGIAPDMMPRLFTLFTQAPSSARNAEGGLGIGLALARSFVELHGGSVGAKSEGIGHGSEFCVRLPFVAVEARAEDDERQAVSMGA